MIVHILQMWELKQRGIKDVPQITWRSRVRKLLATLCWMGDSEGPPLPLPEAMVDGKQTNNACLSSKGSEPMI